jgi:hypothetical protein
MIGKLRSALIGLGLAASLALGTSIVGATDASVALSAGTLSFTAPTDFSYPATTLNGAEQDLSSSFSVSVNDPTGSGKGWAIQAQIGVLTSGSDTILASAHTLASVPTVTHVTGLDPVNTLSAYPMTIPTSTATVFNAQPGSGKGKSTVNFATQLAVPADAAAGTYHAGLTVTVVQGP